MVPAAVAVIRRPPADPVSEELRRELARLRRALPHLSDREWAAVSHQLVRVRAEQDRQHIDVRTELRRYR
jgi:hypothetical protein